MPAVRLLLLAQRLYNVPLGSSQNYYYHDTNTAAQYVPVLSIIYYTVYHII